MFADLSFDVCSRCSSRELRRAKLRGPLELLASPLLIPYRCRACDLRQFKHAGVRINSAKSSTRSPEKSAVPVEVNRAVFVSSRRPRQVRPASYSAVATAPPPPAESIAPAQENPPSNTPTPNTPAVPPLRGLVTGAVQGIGLGLARLRKPVLCVLVIAAGIELILQAAAASIWFSHKPQPRHLVLCIGDSYTFGNGATTSEFSYPAVLETLLRQDDKTWQVVNAGWPDLDSRDTALALPNQLLRYRPSVVYILVGARDFLTRPKAAPPGIAKAVAYDFPLILRTPLLFESLAHQSTDLYVSSQAALWHELHVIKFRWRHLSGPSPAGTWLYQKQVVRIQSDGTVRFGGLEFRWDTSGNQLDLFPVNGNTAPAMHFRWARQGRALLIQGGGFPTGTLLQPVEENEALKLEAKTVHNPPLKSGRAQPPASGQKNPEPQDPDPQIAQEEKLEKALSIAKPPSRFYIRSNLTRVYARDAKRGLAESEFAKMLTEMDAAGDPEAMVETFIETAEKLGDGARALATARTYAPRFASNPFLQKTIAWESYENRDFSTAAAASEKALQLARDNKTRVDLLNMRAQILLDVNIPQSLSSVIEAYQIKRDEFELRRRLEPNLVLYSSELVDSTLDKLKADFWVRQGVHDAITELRHRRYGDISSVMTKNLRLMAEMVRSTGAQVVFLSYPFTGVANVNEALRRVAGEEHASLTDIETAVTKRLSTTAKEQIFAPDGHFTNAGYAMVAQLAAAEITRRKQ